MSKVYKDWEKQPQDQGTLAKNHFVLTGMSYQLVIVFTVFVTWIILITPSRIPYYDQPPPIAEQWKNFGSLFGSVSADLAVTGNIFVTDSAWLFPALLAVIIACYAVVVAGGTADVGTPIRALRLGMPLITIVIGAFAWVWGGVLVLEAWFGYIALPNLWAPLTLSAVVAIAAAGFTGFDYDPPHVRAKLLDHAKAAHTKAQELSNLSKAPEASHSLSRAKINTKLAPIGIGLVGTLIYILILNFFETDPGQRTYNLWALFSALVLDLIIWFGWTAAALWFALDYALISRTRAIMSRPAFWLITMVSLGVYLFMALMLTPSLSERFSFLVSNGFVLFSVIILTLLTKFRQSRITRSYWRERRAGELIENAQEKLFVEHSNLRPVPKQSDLPIEEIAKALTRRQTAKTTICNLVATALRSKR